MGSFQHFLFSLLYHLTSIGKARHGIRTASKQPFPTNSSSGTGFQLSHCSVLPAFFQMTAFLYFPYGENLLTTLKFNSPHPPWACFGHGSILGVVQSLPLLTLSSSSTPQMHLSLTSLHLWTAWTKPQLAWMTCMLLVLLDFFNLFSVHCRGKIHLRSWQKERWHLLCCQWISPLLQQAGHSCFTRNWQ